MMDEWIKARDELLREVTDLGFPEELGCEMAKALGSPKAICRMTAYLRNDRPRTAETAVDEMLAIISEIDAWKDKKRSEEANSKLNEWYNRRY